MLCVSANLRAPGNPARNQRIVSMELSSTTLSMWHVHQAKEKRSGLPSRRDGDCPASLMLLVHWDRREGAHGGLVDLRRELSMLLHHLRHQLEIVDIESGREGIEEPGLFVERIRERMKCSHRDSNVIAWLSVDIGLGFLEASGMEAHGSFGHEEGFIVHLVPMRRRAGSVRWDDELNGCEAIVWENDKRLRKG